MPLHSFSNTDSTNYIHIAGRTTYNASDYTNATMLAVSVMSSISATPSVIENINYTTNV